MKRLILVLLIFVTLDSFAQLKVKEGSFKKVENCVILDKRYDDNNNPMALIRIYTENILPEQKRDFFFDSDFGTNLEPSIAESGEIELYAQTKYSVDDCLVASCAPCDIDIDPDDIQAGDTATFVWEIV